MDGQNERRNHDLSGRRNTKNEFSTAAKTQDRTSAQLLRDFMRDFVRQQQEAALHDTWFRQQVRAGLDSANAGHLVPDAEVEAEFAARRAARMSCETSSPWLERVTKQAVSQKYPPSPALGPGGHSFARPDQPTQPGKVPGKALQT